MNKTFFMIRSGAVGCMLALLLALVPVSASAQGSAPSDDSSSDSGDSTAGPPTSLDPCQVVTSAEASSIANAAFTTGVEQGDSSGGARTCVYGYQTLNVFMVTVAQATDSDTANADWTQYEAQAQQLLQKNLPAGVNITLNLSDTTDVPGYDRAALGSGTLTVPGHTISLSAIYLLHGSTFVTYSDLLADNAPPSTDLLESEAQTILPRIS